MTSELIVIKRDGKTKKKFNVGNVSKAINAAAVSAAVSVNQTDLESLLKEIETNCAEIAVLNTVSVESIQDIVETKLMATMPDVAKSYILYRQKRSEVRVQRLRPDSKAIADYIHPGRYARFIPELKRREVYLETVDRSEGMHLDKFRALFEKDPGLEAEIRWAFDQVREKRVLPSMRGFQFGGAAILAKNERIYNCCFSFIDRPRAFAEALYLLLCGTGVGFSVQFEHIEKLPTLKRIDEDNVVHHTIGDDIEGWANAMLKLFDSYVKGYYIEFNYSKVRDKGTPLKTSGGRAPGHMELKKSLENIRMILDGAVGRKLRPIEAYDILCFLADAVLSGGIRRSAMIAVFSLEDGEMMNAKTGKWYEKTPWRENSNNSVMLKRDEVKKKSFKRIFNYIKEFGEPGFYFCDDLESGPNPCVEIGLKPVLHITPEVMEMVAKREAKGKTHPKFKMGDKITGWQMCNLTEQNAAKFLTEEDFYRAARAATIIGTLQASYTDFSYLGPVSELITEREALLGVSMTGMMDSPEISLNPEYQRRAMQVVKEVNEDIARRIGINSAARASAVKPAGSTSLELEGVASGIHGHHADRYIRRVTANELEPVFQYFKSVNPHMCIKKPNGDWVVEFAVEAPEGALTKSDFTAIEFLEKVKSTQANWVTPGTFKPEMSPGVSHNVSNTCIIGPDEWDTVPEYVWENRHIFSGISFLPATGDKDFAFAPMEAIVTEADEAKWNYLLAHYKPVDYSLMVEDEDGTNLTGEAACANGKCAT
jgi:ribonucleoside-triphosphate reductase